MLCTTLSNTQQSRNMMFKNLLIDIFTSITTQKLRTFLTGFGIAWGIFILVLLLGASGGLLAQTNSYDNDIEKLLQINGSTGTYDVMFNQLKQQLAMGKPDVPDSVWSTLKTVVFDKEVTELTKQLVPLYKKHFTQKEVKEMIAFYESPAGKKLAKETPAITSEAMTKSQPWAMMHKMLTLSHHADGLAY